MSSIKIFLYSLTHVALNSVVMSCNGAKCWCLVFRGAGFYQPEYRLIKVAFDVGFAQALARK